MHLFLSGVAVLTQTASIATEVVLLIKGCCTPNPKLCEYQKKFEHMKNKMKIDYSVIEKNWEYCK